MAHAARRPLRWGALMGVASAIRSASRPGAPGVGERLAALPRMVRAIMTRKYSGVDGSKLLMMLAAVGYVVSPIDLMPEAMLFIAGLGDDALVVGWLAVTIINATDDFLDWERTGDFIPGQVYDTTGQQPPHYDVI
ncbi:YkvA family protein [Ornithinimicrobium faecis]|uniref:DUF1232 domain-containing protein n=1 Tax=Ornithinimicrobium faecis TaxID=2934158 RepID=A0ABY4YXW7_9MICO|nr:MULTISPECIES: DUF1232 domain-containing protein [unclassified Ornithinimicrobium]USQ81452.1 DUF1232 domain-containing protein [Ornithinimicrobium sp. HY1793]